MKKLLFSLMAIVAFTGVNAQGNAETKQREKALIKSMAGTYRVDFQFAETFSPDTAYKYHDRKFEWGIEYVTVIEDTENKISLQHLLIVSDSMIIKHWRQDWVYENRELLTFVGNDEWKKETIPADKAKGTWTQKVFQVDDGPRYEGYGTWIHADGRHYWESVADAPLPRREHTKRNDYNVLKRHSHVEIFNDGSWVLEQDNEKILRKDGTEKLIAWEKGIERFTKSDYNPQAAVAYWNKTQDYWKDVRTAWDLVLAKHQHALIKTKANGERLYNVMFTMADEYAKPKKHDSKKVTAEVEKVLNAYVEDKSI